MKVLGWTVVVILAILLGISLHPPRELSETREQAIARRVARDNPHLVPDPLIHPDINRQWIIQFNPTTKKYRAFWLHAHMPLWFECDSHKEAADELNETHLKNVRAERGDGEWEVAQP